MNCANCGAPVRPNQDTGIVTCAYCATARLPEPRADGVQIVAQTQLVCPGCRAFMAEGKLESQDLLYCQSCRGMLIPMGGFVSLIERLRLQRDRPVSSLPPMPTDRDLPRLCPYCTRAMDNHPYMGPGNIVIDTCSGCQVNWLDKGELQRAVIAPDHVPSASLYSDYGLPHDTDERERTLFERILDL